MSLHGEKYRNIEHVKETWPATIPSLRGLNAGPVHSIVSPDDTPSRMDWSRG
jgi:hypothetical protein